MHYTTVTVTTTSNDNSYYDNKNNNDKLLYLILFHYIFTFKNTIEYVINTNLQNHMSIMFVLMDHHSHDCSYDFNLYIVLCVDVFEHLQQKLDFRFQRIHNVHSK